MKELLKSFQVYIALVLVILALGWTTVHYRDKWLVEKTETKALTNTIKSNGEKAKKDAEEREALWKAQFKQSEEQHAKDKAVTAANFARELDRLRRAAGDSAGGRLPEDTPTVSVCDDAAGNARLSNALSIYRGEERRSQIEVLQLFESCQKSTDTLIQCQSDLTTLTR